MEEPRGSEPGYRRPVVIASSDHFNLSKINTVIVAVITSNLRLAEAPGNFKLVRSSSKLRQDSVVNVSQLITFDKSFLTERVGRLNNEQTRLLDEGLRMVLAI